MAICNILHKVHPASTISIIPGCKPYAPQKGEPLYAEWKKWADRRVKRLVEKGVSN
jgi:hypothetical protein